MTEKYTDLLTGAFFIALGLGLELWLVPVAIHVPQGLPNLAQSPALWPRIIAIFLALLGCLLVLQSRPRSHRRVEQAAADADSPEAKDANWLSWLRGLAAIVLLVPYYFACSEYGLLLPSIVALAIYSLLAGEKRVTTLVLVSVIFPLCLTEFFIRVAHILIPVGPLDSLL